MNLTPCRDTRNEHGHRQVETDHGFAVDEHALPVLELLWSRGIETVCSCQGEIHAVCGDDECDTEHEHPGYVSIVGLRQAMRAYRLLTTKTGIFGNLVRVCEDHRHTADDEYAIWTPPMEQLADVLGDIPDDDDEPIPAHWH